MGRVHCHPEYRVAACKGEEEGSGRGGIAAGACHPAIPPLLPLTAPLPTSFWSVLGGQIGVLAKAFCKANKPAKY